MTEEELAAVVAGAKAAPAAQPNTQEGSTNEKSPVDQPG